MTSLGLARALSEGVGGDNEGAFERSMVKVGEYLTTLKTVLIFVADSRNFGHQSSSINILFNLVEMGFPGDFIVVYQNREALNKLAILLPMNAGSTDPITVPIGGRDVNIRFASLASKPEGDLGLTGGFDYPVGGLADLQCPAVVELQPYMWQEGGSQNVVQIREPAQVFSLPDVLHMPAFNDLGFYLEDPQLDRRIVDMFAAMPRWQAKIEVLQAVLELYGDEKNFLLCPAYGVNTRSLHPVVILFNLLCGITDVQSLEYVDDKAVVLVFSPEEKFGSETINYATLLEFLATGHWRGGNPFNFMPKPECAEYLTRSEMDRRVRVYSEAAPSRDGVRAAFEELEDDGVLVVQVGPIPSILFNYIYSVANLPFVFEGQNTAVTALNLGRPYLHLTVGGSDVDVYPSLPVFPPRGVVPASQIAGMIARKLTSYPCMWWPDPDQNKNPNNVLGAFAEMALTGEGYDPDERLTVAYFRSLRRFYHDPKNDKLRLALGFLVDQLERIGQ